MRAAAEIEGRQAELGRSGARGDPARAACSGSCSTPAGLHKSAFNQPAGTRRTVALALTAGLANVSNALKIDQPRAWLKEAIGRSGDDSIDTRVVVPVQAAPLASPRPVLATHAAVPGDPTVKRKAFTPSDPMRLWVAGDSLIIDTGYALQRAALATPVIKNVGGVDGRIGTGLDRPDIFNWFLEIRRELQALHPNAVVLGFGGNDDKQYMTGLPPGVTITEFDDPSWRREYARRVGGLIDLINRAGAYVVWVGLPITQGPGADGALRHDQRGRRAGDRQAPGRCRLSRHLLAPRCPERRLRAVPDVAHRAGPGREGARRRPLLAGGSGDRRPAGAEGSERGLRPDELAAVPARARPRSCYAGELGARRLSSLSRRPSGIGSSVATRT